MSPVKYDVGQLGQRKCGAGSSPEYPMRCSRVVRVVVKRYSIIGATTALLAGIAVSLAMTVMDGIIDHHARKAIDW